ncbi:MAG TPA: alpha-amylase/4-alpha-glucanotransferase domain-containing protein [Candidatus Deferrimicrobium sp.]|nr:alpha-amylase/4-alpha-glucanotransferase domain-containing protein [Candidatus Deferrimicrobium sp.]
MAKFRLAFGVHNHQPVGNFQSVFEQAHENAYQPFLQLLQSFPSIGLTLHQSGILWRWQEENHPEYLELVRGMVVRGQIELMTGGFYEPILTAIPERDVYGQIGMLSEYISAKFGIDPQGLWLTERIWEPHLPRVLVKAGVKYLPVDDTHFVYAGLDHAQLSGPFVTEHEGFKVILLPIQKRLRYLIPFGTVEQVVDELKRQADSDPAGLAVYADDGEKFGVWPQTHEHCFGERWVAQFFEALAANADWLEIVPLNVAAADEPVGRVYLPSASYAEMLHWALPSAAFVEYEDFETWLREQKQWERFGRFVRGGHWRGFLSKYEESNLKHKKMLSVSDKLAEFDEKYPARRREAEAARDRLYAGQCNCPYWHGVFGGLYLPHIRQSVMSALVEADARLDRLLQRPPLEFRAYDYDADGHDEIISSGETFTAVFTPHRGGSLVHLALNKHSFDVTDTLSRRKEGYHAKLDRAVLAGTSAETSSIHDLVLAKEEGLTRYLVEDWYLKRCFVDHFFTGDVDLSRFQSGKYGEEGDFILEPFTCRVDAREHTITMTRDGHLWRPGAVVPVRVIKQFRFAAGADEIRVRYELKTLAGHRLSVQFAIENNFNFQAGHAQDRFVQVDHRRAKDSFLDSVEGYDQAESYAVIDQFRNLAVALASNQPCSIWHLPIHTVSLSEGGFEKVYQGTTLVNLFRIELSEDPFAVNLSLIAGNISTVMNRLPKLTAVSSA